jgi:hypothetical protein
MPFDFDIKGSMWATFQFVFALPVNAFLRGCIKIATFVKTNAYKSTESRYKKKHFRTELRTRKFQIAALPNIEREIADVQNGDPLWPAKPLLLTG